MLLLTRRVGECVQLGDGIRVRVMGIQGAVVRLGFEAPSDVLILRQELVEERKGTDTEDKA